MIKINDGKICLWVKYPSDLESQALDQLKNISSLPFIYEHVAGMADCHFGAGTSVGTVFASRNMIIPSAIGSDIGCGMLAIDLGIRVEALGDQQRLYDLILDSIPVGFSIHEQSSNIKENKDALKFCGLEDTASDRLRNLKLRKDLGWNTVSYQLGSLGGGNHFLELCDDGGGNAWLMLHSGSRNVGKCCADFHKYRAKQECVDACVHLPDKDLSYFLDGSKGFEDYIADMNWCQEYAALNRNMMLKTVLRTLGLDAKVDPNQAINCHHNYAAKEWHYGEEVWVTRKGAINAAEWQMGIVPGAMGIQSYIVRGKGLEESFKSSAHGAGRRFSRGEAKRTFTIEDAKKQTVGVICRKDNGILDELPGAYKDIDVVMENQKDLVEVVKTLKAFVCVKG